MTPDLGPLQDRRGQPLEVDAAQVWTLAHELTHKGFRAGVVATLLALKMNLAVDATQVRGGLLIRCPNCPDQDELGGVPFMRGAVMPPILIREQP